MQLLLLPPHLAFTWSCYGPIFRWLLLLLSLLLLLLPLLSWFPCL